MPSALISRVWRFSNSSRPKNTMPAFGAAVKPLIDRPGKATESFTPGTDSAMSSTDFVPSVRYGCAPLPYGQAAAPTFVAVVRTVRPRSLASSFNQSS